MCLNDSFDIVDKRSYDNSELDRMVDMIDALAMGTIVLITTQTDWSVQMSARVANALKSLGAKLPNAIGAKYTEGNSFSLIGYKGAASGSCAQLFLSGKKKSVIRQKIAANNIPLRVEMSMPVMDLLVTDTVEYVF